MLLRRYLHPTLDVCKEKQRRNDNDDFSSDQPAGSRLHARRSSSGLIFAPKHSHLLEFFFFFFSCGTQARPVRSGQLPICQQDLGGWAVLG